MAGYSASGEGGAWKSEDSGTSWKSIGPPRTFGQSLARDPADLRTIYLGTVAGRYRSRDAGGSWAKIDPGWVGNVTAIHVVDASTVFASVYTLDRTTVHYGPMTPGFFRTTDGGGTWTNLSENERPVTSCAFFAPILGDPRTFHLILNGITRYEE